MSKESYEFGDQNVKVVAVLKLVRAGHGVNAMSLLAAHGFVIDFGATVRQVFDCIQEVYFLLEEFPKQSSLVEQFVKAYFETTSDRYLEVETPPVPTKKIRAGMTRTLAGKQDHNTLERIKRVYDTHSGYVHANYAHTMEPYAPGDDSFHITGVPDVDERLKRAEWIEQAGRTVLNATGFAALRFGLRQLHADIAKYVLDNLPDSPTHASS